MAKHKSLKITKAIKTHPRHIKARRWFAGIIGVLGLAEGLVLMSNVSITGNVINETLQANYSVLGSVVFLIGLVSAILSLKRN